MLIITNKPVELDITLPADTGTPLSIYTPDVNTNVSDDLDIYLSGISNDPQQCLLEIIKDCLPNAYKNELLLSIDQTRLTNAATINTFVTGVLNAN